MEMDVGTTVACVEVMGMMADVFGEEGVLQQMLTLSTVESILAYMRLHMDEPVKVLRPCTQTLANFACDNTPLVNRIVAAGGVTVCEEVMQVRRIGCTEYE